MKLGFALLAKGALCVLCYTTLTQGTLSLEIFLVERKKISMTKTGGSCLEGNAHHERSLRSFYAQSPFVTFTKLRLTPTHS